MAFDSGSVSFRIFYLAGALPEDLVRLFGPHAAPPPERMGIEPVSGWVGGRHLLDLPLTEENTALGGYPRLTLMRAERRVPPSLFRAHCLLEEQAQMKAERRPFLNRKARAEIRGAVLKRLLPEMPPTLQGIPFAADRAAGVLYAAALSDAQLDAFRLAFLRATGIEAIPADAASMAARRSRVDVRPWSPVSFAEDVRDEEAGANPGQEFLTWLWHMTETGGELTTDPDHGLVGAVIEGPLLFSIPEGNGAQEAVLRRGAPTLAAEACTCLAAGKKLRRAKLTLAIGKDPYTTTFDAETFVFRGLKIPEEEPRAADPVTRFQERMARLAVFRDAFGRLFDRFVDLRENPAQWPATVTAMRRWVAERRGMR